MTEKDKLKDIPEISKVVKTTISSLEELFKNKDGDVVGQEFLSGVKKTCVMLIAESIIGCKSGLKEGACIECAATNFCMEVLMGVKGMMMAFSEYNQEMGNTCSTEKNH